jgi:2-polyprenyl-3-methyl-5-hydroxy-6-metoxy-1,4-benzoquinol methylase
MSRANHFLIADDELGVWINQKASELYQKLSHIDGNAFAAGDVYNDYFRNHHLGNRLFFSIQNSAHILYDAVKLSGKPLHEINAIDYGAGLGTLFMLGGMLGFKRFDYNDYFAEWKNIALAFCNTTGISIQDYITGDVEAVTAFAASKNITYDIVVSRNVIEHIYNLPQFYKAWYRHNRAAVIYSTTTANYHNPAMRWYHLYIHKKTEKQYYRQQRIEAIKKLQPAVPENTLKQLAELTRGRAMHDFEEAIALFSNNKPVAPVPYLRSNVCDCLTGVWCEHLLKKNEYQTIINQAGYKILYTAGYWDTHYRSVIKNMAAAILNRVIKIAGQDKAVVFSPFVNIVAYN